MKNKPKTKVNSKKKKNNAKKKTLLIINVVLHVLALFSIIYLTYGVYKIQALGDLFTEYMSSKYVLPILFTIFIITTMVLINLLRISKKKIILTITSVFLVLTTTSVILGTKYLMDIEKAIQGASAFGDTQVEIVLAANKQSEITEVDNTTVGLLSNENSNEGFIAPTEYLKDKSNVIVSTEYYTWHDLILGLENGEVDVIVLPATYETLLETDEAYKAFKDNLVIIDTYKMTIKQEQKSIGDAGKPFNMLLVGTDSPLNGTTTGYLFDVVIIATIDPQMGSVVLTSIPRDSTLYSPCIGGYDKITHNGSYGIECLSSTLEETFNTTIDYYMIIGFEGIIDIVEYLGGVTITNPYGDIKVQDSKRRADAISIPGGTNLLNGEQTLAFARNRKATETGVPIDANVRSSNHVVVLKAILARMKETGIASDIDGLINVVAESTITNFPINDLVSISKIATSLLQNNTQIVNITLQGIGIQYNSPAAGGMLLYGYLPYQESITYITNYISMVYNGTYIPLDPSMSISTGDPKVEQEQSYNYGVPTTPYVPPAATTPEPAPEQTTPTTPPPGGDGGDGGTGDDSGSGG